ncbi:MFS transporter [Roseibium sp. RKSG952]|uniref:MFS transporter n=1 Tax=Roseibium sp. RKSG952 TaxID=2529384 RepID=UPI0012BD788C|nr:MFS transporter [Roseibium sp. RKSG952]MTH98857.1 MFS transporter [Roseibium sp. RKSG952]
MVPKLNRTLLGVNFFSGDVVAGLGPYLAIYLLSAYHWKPGGIGMALAVGSIATVIVQTPAGAFIDETRRKRLILAICAVLIGVSSVLLVVTDDPAWLVYTAQIAIGISGAFLGPGIAAITLGIVGPDRFTAQTSANQAWNHAGNVFGASIGAAVALLWVPGGVFWLIAGMSVGLLVNIVMIDDRSIDHKLARGGVSEEITHGKEAEGFGALLMDRRLLTFALCVVLFHFANAAMLPLVSQKLAAGGDAGDGIAFASASIIAAQFMMIPMALLCGSKADSWGRKPLFLFAFMILPFRGVLYTLTDDKFLLVSIQALDGIANGIFGMIFLLIIADVTRGTGRFNAAQGALTTLIGVGATLSNLVAGWVSQAAGYSTGFLFLASIAVIGALTFAFLMPETAPALQKDARDPVLPTGEGASE